MEGLQFNPHIAFPQVAHNNVFLPEWIPNLQSYSTWLLNWVLFPETVAHLGIFISLCWHYQVAKHQVTLYFLRTSMTRNCDFCVMDVWRHDMTSNVLTDTEMWQIWTSGLNDYSDQFYGVCGPTFIHFPTHNFSFYLLNKQNWKEPKWIMVGSCYHIIIYHISLNMNRGIMKK